MRNGVKYYRTIGSAEMETFLEKAGYTTMTINQIIKEIDISKNRLQASLKLSDYDLSTKFSWTNERDRDLLYGYLKQASDLTDDEIKKMNVYPYSMIESRLDSLYKSNLNSMLKPSRFVSAILAENLINKRMEEIILNGEI